MDFSLIKPSNSLLLISSVGSSQSVFESFHSLLSQHVPQGKASFELLERFNSSSPTSTYDTILLFPSQLPLQPLLEKAFNLLNPGGLLITFNILPENTSSLSNSDLKTPFILSGYSDVTNSTLPSAADPKSNLDENTTEIVLNLNNYIESKNTNFYVSKTVSFKPQYKLGSGQAIKLNKEKVKSKPGKFASFLNNDDEDELIDDDELLEDADYMKPSPLSLSRPDSDKPQRRACKNCTCGLAQQEMEASKAVKISTEAPEFQSSCGNCSLGDAFRCSTCPYIGMPAFNPGEEIKLSGNMMDDDVVF
ncbi:hypothetical protein BB559_004647 [Furculomyces boomerangus]|uniref:Uncharacterized protein n=2 Tax=Harpellales TaxID=61421 RepID=A0A2T9YDD8_9FUNG|nr:hypothetical protein BB559_004647 [Furculomyces boomerangus]PWA00209.1 hypothetical protein BB558_003740 [Smittium angustum]